MIRALSMLPPTTLTLTHSGLIAMHLAMNNWGIDSKYSYFTYKRGDYASSKSYKSNKLVEISPCGMPYAGKQVELRIIY